MHDRHNASSNLEYSSAASWWFAGIIIYSKLSCFNSCLYLCFIPSTFPHLLIYFTQALLCKVSEAKPKKLACPGQQPYWLGGSQSQLFLMHYYSNIKFELYFIKAYVELMFPLWSRSMLTNPPWGNERRTNTAIVMKSKPEFDEMWRVSGVYQRLLKDGESIGILTSHSLADIDKINDDNPKY